MKGGARVRSGPPASPTSLRQDRPSVQGEWFVLPAEGRSGDPPAWVLTRQSAREKFHWARLWATPQAVAWEAFQLFDAVASYVRALAIAEAPDAKSNDRTLARQYQDSLGLTDAGLRTNRWRIEEVAPAPTKRTNDPDRAAQKAALRAIVGGAA